MKVTFSKGYKMTSTIVVSAGYDTLKNRLGVVCRDGSSYVFEQVPQKVWAQWKRSSSRGQYFNAAIRSGYPSSEAEIAFKVMRNLDESSVIEYTQEDYALPEEAVSDAWF